MPLKAGKLPFDIMESILKKINSRNDDDRLIIGPKMGQHVAVIDMGDKYLVTKTDPITFTSEEMGYYVVNINANDIACSGAIPKWFQATILIPQNTSDESLFEKIIVEIADECERLNISYTGGHSEVTLGIEKPIVVGCMLGEVEKEKLITTMGAKPGDALMLTKGIVIEGASIIVSEKMEYLKEKGYNQKLLDKIKGYLHDPGISVVKDARLLSENFKVSSMHDPTEGGLANGAVELARNSKCGMIIEYDQIPFLDGTQELCKEFGLDPLGTLSSGCLLFTIDSKKVPEVIEFMKNQNIVVAKIGKLTEKVGKYFLKQKNGDIVDLKHSDTDEITKIF